MGVKKKCRELALTQEALRVGLERNVTMLRDLVASIRQTLDRLDEAHVAQARLAADLLAATDAAAGGVSLTAAQLERFRQDALAAQQLSRVGLQRNANDRALVDNVARLLNVGA